jgi:hypothetical protein
MEVCFLEASPNISEHFGDWVIRAGYISAVERGGQHGAMHEGVREED